MANPYKAKAGEVVKSFPFAYDGINIEHHQVGSAFPIEGRTISDSAFDGLVSAGYLKETQAAKLPPEEQINRDIIDAYDRRLTAASDADLKAIIARSGKPYSGNMVHATLVYVAKQQMLAELQGAEPILGIDPESGVTEQPRAAPGQATPPSAAAAVDRQKAQAENAGPVGGENKATNQFGDPLTGKPSDGSVGETRLDDLTVAELKEHAEIHGIDLGEATKKADIVEAIKASKKD